MTNKWFLKIEDEKSARNAAKQGAYAVLVFTVMILLSAVFIYFYQKGAMDGSAIMQEDALDPIIDMGIVILFQLIMAWRIYSGKGWLASILVLLLFLIEVTAKIIDGTANVGWIIFYVIIAMVMINGFRGCWYLRKLKVK